ncbi:unnamed protein product, partial [Effrenium voratum]
MRWLWPFSVAADALSQRGTGLRPGAPPAEDLTLPLLLWVKENCDPILVDDQALFVQEISAGIKGMINGSRHLHRRFARTGWLLGSVSLENMDPVLRKFASTGWLPPTGIMAWDGMCRKVLLQTRNFYYAWHRLLEVAGGQNFQLYVEAALDAANSLTSYFLAKDASEPTYLQEQQLAMLLRSAIAMNSGIPSNPCTCQLFYQALLRQSVNFWKACFKPEHLRQGPSGDVRHDGALDNLVQEASPCTIIKEHSWDMFVPPLEALLLPEEDQLTGNFACLPKRIVTLMVCGQYWLHRGDTKMAKRHFHGASQMLVMSMDCFDTSMQSYIDGQGNTHLLNLQELFAYLGRLDQDASPFAGWEEKKRRWTGSREVFSSKWPPQEGKQRTLMMPLLQNAAVMPPLCFDTNGTLHLRLSGYGDRRLQLFDWTGTWSLMPVRPLAGLMQKTETKAVLIYVDNPAWGTLGHCIHHLTAVTFATLGSALLRGGVPEMLKLRATMQLYLYFPRRGLRDAGFEVGHFRSSRSVMLPWLSLLSPRPPLLMSDEQPLINRSALPPPLQVADLRTCHGGGVWISRTGKLSREELDAFVQVAGSFPGWSGRSKKELLQLVWGQGRQGDDCLLEQTGCLRVLIVRRGAMARGKRTVVNLPEALSWISAHYSADEVRVAAVEMEQFTIGEEIALAQLADVFIGSYGSAMWWPIFMAEGSCVMWLTPHVKFWYHKGRPMDLSAPVWSNTGALEYQGLRKLRHVHVGGGLPPQGTPGEFQLSEEEERSDQLAFQKLDVFLDLPKFGIAFSEAVAKLFADHDVE